MLLRLSDDRSRKGDVAGLALKLDPPASDEHDVQPTPPPPGRPVLVTAAAVTGIVVGALASLRGLIVLSAAGLVLFQIPPRVFGVLLLLPVGGLVLAGGVQALRNAAPTLLRLGGWALVGVDLLNAATWVAGGYGFPVNDFLGAVLAAVPVFLILQRPAREFYAAHGRPY